MYILLVVIENTFLVGSIFHMKVNFNIIMLLICNYFIKIPIFIRLFRDDQEEEDWPTYGDKHVYWSKLAEYIGEATGMVVRQG